MMTTAPQQHPTPPPRDLAQAASTPSCPLSAVLPGAARGAVEASAVLAAASTERRPLRALRRELSATDIRIIAEPSSSAARQHGRSVRTEQSVSSGSRFYANIVAKLHRERAAREEARTNDKWLVVRRAFPAGVPATGARAPRAEGAERKLKPESDTPAFAGFNKAP